MVIIMPGWLDKGGVAVLVCAKIISSQKNKANKIKPVFIFLLTASFSVFSGAFLSFNFIN